MNRGTSSLPIGLLVEFKNVEMTLREADTAEGRFGRCRGFREPPKGNWHADEVEESKNDVDEIAPREGGNN